MGPDPSLLRDKGLCSKMSLLMCNHHKWVQDQPDCCLLTPTSLDVLTYSYSQLLEFCSASLQIVLQVEYFLI